MRITNIMMTNSMLTNINKNMSNLDKYYTQMASGKKIQMPSDDPIIASRALKLRNIVSSTEQYNSNANQGISWMETTESAFKNITSILTSMSELCVQGASDQYKEDDRKKILHQFNSYVGRLESEINSTYMGRYVFSGYMTDKPPILKDAATGKNTLNKEIYNDGNYVNIDDVLDKVQNGPIKEANDILDQIANLNGQIAGGDTSVITQRDDLIDKLKDTISATDYEIFVSPDKQTIQLHSIPTSGGGGSSGGSGSTGDGSITISVDLINGTTVNHITADKNTAGDGLDFVVDGVDIDIKIPGEIIEGATHVSGDRIKLEVGVNNYIDINSVAPEVYTEEMYSELHYFDKVYDYMSGTLSNDDIDTYFGGKPFSELSQSEIASFDSNLRSQFEEMITKINNFNSSVTEQHTNLGVRMNRIYLIQERLGDDNVNYTNLMSKNENINYADTAMKFNVANASYQAALRVGMNITQLTLADFL